MPNDIFLYVLGFLITLNLLTVWIETNFSVNLLKSLRLIKKDIYLREELEEHLTDNWGYVGELLVCPICFATHLSWIVGLIMWLVCQNSLWAIPAGMFSWPGMAYITLRFVRRSI